MTNASNSCGSCLFYDEHHANGGQPSQDGGLCRFNPPVSQPGPDAHGLWPVVTEKDWCGHFSPEALASMSAAE